VTDSSASKATADSTIGKVKSIKQGITIVNLNSDLLDLNSTRPASA
jgi:hypothetical protein